MPFIELNNYYGDAHAENLWKEIQPFFNLVLGSALTLMGGWLVRVYDRKAIGKNFNYQLDGLKKPIIKQIKDLEKLYEDYTKHGNIGRIPVYKESKFLDIGKLDRVKLINYLKWQKPYSKMKAPEAVATERVGNVMYLFDCLAELSVKLFKDSENFRESRKQLVKDYRKHLNIIRRTIARIHDESDGKNELTEEIFKEFVKLMEIYYPNNNLGIELILKANTDFLLPLITKQPFINKDSGIFSDLNTFVQNASDAIGSYKADEREHYDKVKEVIGFFKIAFKSIYEVDAEDYLEEMDKPLP